MSELEARSLLSTDTVAVWDVLCPGHSGSSSAEECATGTHLVFPYRGAYVHHVGRAEHVAEANQVVFLNDDEPYRVSHPIGGGDASISVGMDAATLLELTPPDYRHPHGRASFNRSGLRVDTATQVLAAALRQRLDRGVIDRLEAETSAIDLVRHTLMDKESHTAAQTGCRAQKIADRAKVMLSSDLSRRWTLKEVASDIGVSPVYLTDVFRRVEGLPLYRYHLRLRLARALAVLADYDNLADLAFDLGFTSHSHFSAAFKQAYLQTPSEFQAAART
jgi:AraC family transcriptional regulator